jgi:hypothetical protein
VTMPGNEFESGFSAPRDSAVGMSLGLLARSAQFNELATSSIGRPQSVLSQLSPSPIAANLSAPSQQSRLLPNGFVLPNTAQGSSPQSAETANYLMMRGDDVA